MFRSLRKAAISLGIKKDVDEDQSAKQRMVDIKTAHDNLKKHFVTYVKALTEAGAQTAALHEAMHDLYPEGQALSPQMLSLAGRSPAFTEPGKVAEALKGEVDAALANLLAKRNEVSKMVDDRATYRQDIMHYQEKIPQLEQKAATNPKEQQKVAENKAKLEEVEAKFKDLDAALVPELEKLDSALAELINGSFKAFLDRQVATAKSVLDTYEAAAAGTPPPVDESAAAAAAEGGSSGAGEPANA